MTRTIMIKAMALSLLVWAGTMVYAYGQDNKIERLGNRQFKKKAKKERAIILDVRTPDEFKEGHIPTAILMDYLDTEKFMAQIITLDKSKTYLLYCRSGKRSLKAAMAMKEKGLLNVCDLKGGYRKWKGPAAYGSQ